MRKAILVFSVLGLVRGGPTSLDRFAAMLSYNSLVDVRPLVSHL
jgi:hypothetical protein